MTSFQWNANTAAYSSIGLFFKLYRERFGTLPLTVTGNLPQKTMKGTVMVDIPEKSSGSDTYPLDVMAALSADKQKLTLSIVNPTFTEQDIDLSFNGVKLKQGYDSYQIKAPFLRAVNRPGEDPKISVVNSRIESIPGTFKVSPLSITLYEMIID